MVRDVERSFAEAATAVLLDALVDLQQLRDMFGASRQERRSAEYLIRVLRAELRARN